jgi:hypothetical protein
MGTLCFNLQDMKHLMYTILAGAFIVSGCGSNDNGVAKQDTAIAANLAASYKKTLQGRWRWVDDTTFHFIVANYRSYYVRHGVQDPDTSWFAVSDTNFNPQARYADAAKHILRNKTVYMNTEKIVGGHPVDRRCFAIMALSDSHLQVMETETGTYFEYQR